MKNSVLELHIQLSAIDLFLLVCSYHSESILISSHYSTNLTGQVICISTIFLRTSKVIYSLAAEKLCKRNLYDNADSVLPSSTFWRKCAFMSLSLFTWKPSSESYCSGTFRGIGSGKISYSVELIHFETPKLGWWHSIQVFSSLGLLVICRSYLLISSLARYKKSWISEIISVWG